MVSRQHSFESVGRYSPRTDGFTVVEIVMALVIAGILAAVAVPKYFDMREEAAVKKCRYNQSVIVTDLQQRDAIHRMDSGGAAYSVAEAKVMADQVMQDLGGSGCKSGESCPNLCPDHTGDKGQFQVIVTADELGEISYGVMCSISGHSSNTTVTRDNGFSLLNTFANDYMKSYKNGNEGKHNEGEGKTIIETLGDFFTNYENGHIDSDAYFDVQNEYNGVNYGVDSDGNAYTSMAAVINDSLEAQGIDTSKIVWKLTRTGTGNSPNAGEGWQCIYTVSIADKGAAGEVTVQNYQMTVTYNPNTEQYRDPKTGLVGVKSIKTIQTAQTTKGTLTKTTVDGVDHYRLD